MVSVHFIHGYSSYDKSFITPPPEIRCLPPPTIGLEMERGLRSIFTFEWLKIYHNHKFTKTIGIKTNFWAMEHTFSNFTCSILASFSI